MMAGLSIGGVLRRWPGSRVSRGFLLVALLWLCLAAQAQPMRRALLVGVSELPDQTASAWLRAPRNDVQLMRQTLLAQGWTAQGIQVLADGVVDASLPRLDAIRSALANLVAQARPGELIVLYFSGHGVRVHGAPKHYDEPDGLAEVFLTRDGALRDVEMGAWIQALLAKGAFVWSVFDTCSATSMTRGGVDAPVSPGADDDVRFRGLRWADLGSAFRRLLQASLAERTVIPSETRVAPPARYVALFAAESHQVTPELRLPRDQAGAPAQGLLTWSIVQALARRPSTWRSLYNDVLEQYAPIVDELARRYPDRELPSPVMEGALDAPLFDDRGVAASTQPVWPARRDGDALQVAAGRLDGLTPGQALQLTAWLPSGVTREFTARADVVGLEATQLALSPTMRGAPEGVWWQVSAPEAPADLALRVHAPPGPARQALQGLNLSYPASIGLTESAEAHWLISVRGTGFAVQTAGQGSVRTLPDAVSLRQFLSDQASLRWLQRLADLPQHQTIRPLPGFRASLVSGPDSLGAWREQALTAQPTAPTGRAAVEIENSSGASVDLLIVGVTADLRLIPVFPSSLGETNRFERGDAATPARKRFALPPPLIEPGAALLVLATPARPRSPVRLYGFSPERNAAALDFRVRGAGTSTGDMAYVVMARW